MSENYHQHQANLKLNIKTWTRDSHGLFDYEANSSKISVLDIQDNCNLIRKKNEVKCISENCPISFEERSLGKIIFKEEKIIISNPFNFLMSPTEKNISDIQNKIWYVIKHDDSIKEKPTDIINSSMHELKLNDIIKLGRVKYVITEVYLNDKKDDNQKEEENPDNKNNNNENLEEERKPVFQLVSDFK